MGGTRSGFWDGKEKATTRGDLWFPTLDPKEGSRMGHPQWLLGEERQQQVLRCAQDNKYSPVAGGELFEAAAVFQDYGEDAGFILGNQ